MNEQKRLREFEANKNSATITANEPTNTGQAYKTRVTKSPL
jgi:hypothetical protein